MPLPASILVTLPFISSAIRTPTQTSNANAAHANLRNMGHLLVAPNTQVPIIPAPRRNNRPFRFVDGNAVMFIQPAKLVKEGAGGFPALRGAFWQDIPISQ